MIFASEEVEKHVIGAIIADGSVAVDCCRALKPSDMYLPKHVVIWGVITKMALRGLEIEILGIAENLRISGLLEAAGGAEYLMEVSREVVSAANVLAHCKIISDHARRREFQEKVKTLSALADMETESLDGLIASTESLAAETRSSADSRHGVSLVSPDEWIPSALGAYDETVYRGESTGWPGLDQLIRIAPGQTNVWTGIPGHGKALALNTPIPTPSGWTTMGDISVGDEVFDENGNICMVIAATDVMVGRPCYELSFSAGEKIICDAEHEWLTESESETRSTKKTRSTPLRKQGSDQSYKKTKMSVKTTKTISTSLKSYGKTSHRIFNAKPIDMPWSRLPIAAYVLGAWLGDGSSSSGGFSDGEGFIINKISTFGFKTTKQRGKYAYGILGFSKPARLLGLLNNKHIPKEYLRAGLNQRIMLLHGLMDTDGSCAKDGQCEFTSVNKQLAYDVYELLCTLGEKPTMIFGRAMLYKKDCGPKYRVMFYPVICPFSMPRKMARVTKFCRQSRFRFILDCKPVESVPVRCIQVDSASHLYLCSKSFIPTHNSEVIDALMLNLAIGSKWRIAFFSPENNPLRRHIQKLAEKSVGKMLYGHMRMSKSEYDSVINNFIVNHFFFFQQGFSGASFEQVLAEASRIKPRINALVVDPWNRLEARRPQGMSETEYILSCLRLAARFASETQISLHIVAHPTKLSEDIKTGITRRPNLYSISGSAHWANAIDNGILVFRNFDTQKTEVQVLKVRFKDNGRVGQQDFEYQESGRYLQSGQPQFYSSTAAKNKAAKDSDPW